MPFDSTGGLQLLPGTKKRLGIKVPGENRFLYIGSAIFGAVLVTIFAINNYTDSLKGHVSTINDELVAIDQKRNKKDELELRLLKDRMAITTDLIKKHTYWTEFFSWFVGVLQREVQVEGLNVSSGGKLTFSASASNYTVVARQIAAFLTDDKISDLTVGNIKSTTNGTVEFGMELTLNLSEIIYK